MTETVMMEDRFGGPLEPDTLMPSQFVDILRRKMPMDGERRLLMAVLEDAVHCFRKNLHATDPKVRQLFLDAEDWILASDRTWFFSFDNVCEMLDIDPEYLREGLMRWKETELRKTNIAVGEALPEPTRDPDASQASRRLLKKACGT